MFYLHKNGIGFRKIERTDLSQLKELKDESWFGTVNTACLNMHDQERWFERISSDKSCIFFIALDLTSDENFPAARRLPPYTPIGLYGITGIDSISQSCEFTHSLFSTFRGRGLGKKTLEAGIDMTFEIFNIRRIETWILANNQAETKSVKAIGFMEEGKKREAVYKCGRFLDCQLFGLLRNEWQTSERVKSMENLCNKSYVPKNG